MKIWIPVFLLGLGFCVFAQAPEVLKERPSEKDYLPFFGPKTARLGERASLKIRGSLPRLDGATAAFPAYAAFVQAVYPEADYSSGKILRCSATAGAYNALIAGRADIIFCYAPSEEQKNAAAEKGISFNMIPVCKDAFVFFVNKNNPVRALSLNQIKDIYSGKITGWNEAGGNDRKITAYQRERGSGSQTTFLEIMKGESVIIPPEEQLVAGMAGLVRVIADYANSENALGYSFRFFTQEMEKSDAIQLLAIDGVSPSIASIQNGSYPFTETLYAITTGNESPRVKQLLEWILSRQGQKLVEKTGYVPVKWRLF